MKHAIIGIGIVIVLLLGACATQPTPTQAPTLAHTATATPVPPTATPQPTPTLSPVEPLLDGYFAGQEIDVSPLSPAEYQEFSVKLTEKMNEQRGINPVVYEDWAYINPDNLIMMNNYDGHPDMEETITMYLAIAGRDAEGNLQIINEKGQTVTVANSADMDWNMVVTDPNDPRIDLAHTGAISTYNGLPVAQWGMAEGKYGIAPMILLDKNPGLIYFKAGGGMIPEPLYHLLKIETDQNGTPIMARNILIFPPVGFGILKEGSPDIIGTFGARQQIEDSTFHSGLIPNSVYYLKIKLDQEDIFKTSLYASADGFTGIISGNEAATSLITQASNDTDMILLGNSGFIEPAD